MGIPEDLVMFKLRWSLHVILWKMEPTVQLVWKEF